MNKTEQNKILEDKIKANTLNFNLNRQSAIVSAFEDGSFDKYEYLTQIDLALKPNSLQRARFQYSSLGDLLSKKLKVDDDDKKDDENDIQDLIDRDKMSDSSTSIFESSLLSPSRCGLTPVSKISRNIQTELISLSRTPISNTSISPEPISLSRTPISNASISPEPISLSRTPISNTSISPEPISLSRTPISNTSISPEPVPDPIDKNTRVKLSDSMPLSSTFWKTFSLADNNDVSRSTIDQLKRMVNEFAYILSIHYDLSDDIDPNLSNYKTANLYDVYFLQKALTDRILSNYELAINNLKSDEVSDAQKLDSLKLVRNSHLKVAEEVNQQDEVFMLKNAYNPVHSKEQINKIKYITNYLPDILSNLIKFNEFIIASLEDKINKSDTKLKASENQTSKNDVPLKQINQSTRKKIYHPMLSLKKLKSNRFKQISPSFHHPK